MPNALEIQDLSTQLNLPEGFVCSEKNINPHAVMAFVFDKNAQVKSSLTWGKKSPYQNSEPIDQHTTIAVGSVTKMFTSAALLKLWDQELTAKKNYGLADDQTENFPDGIDTKLSHFILRLKNKFPSCSYLETIEEIDHYPQVTLRDLLNHTHALGHRDEAKIAKMQLDNPSKEFSCAEVLQFSNYDSNRDKYPNFDYSNLGTELSGMIMELISNKTYDQALKDTVLDPVGATRTRQKSANNSDANSTTGFCYITPCELGEGELRKEYSGEMNFNSSGNSRAAGGLITTPEDADRFIRKFLSKEAGESSLFENQEVIQALFRDENKPGKHNICGVNNYNDGTFGHNGDNALSESSLRYNPTTGESFYYASIGETLSYKIAYEIIHQERNNNDIAKEEVLAKKKELLKAGFGFEEMKNMLDRGVSFKNIAENLSKTLEKTASQPEIKDLETGRGSGSFVEKLGKEESDSKKLFVERMRNDKTQGRSLTGAQEI
jgi:CubicO group peptidase (beta-lactamase class C family)